MTPIDFSGPSGASKLRTADAQAPAQPAGQEKAANAVSPETSKPTGPVELAEAVAQPSQSEVTRLRPEPSTMEDMMLLQSQTLSLARQEEVRLQQKLSDLRNMIERSETDLRKIQTSLLDREDIADPVRD